MLITALDLTTSRADDGAVVKLVGELDPSTAPRLCKELVDLADEGVPNVTLDLAELTFIDSTGLRVLISAQERLRDMGGDLAVHSPTSTAMRLFAITGMGDAFAITA